MKNIPISFHSNETCPDPISFEWKIISISFHFFESYQLHFMKFQWADLEIFVPFRHIQIWTWNFHFNGEFVYVLQYSYATSKKLYLNTKFTSIIVFTWRIKTQSSSKKSDAIWCNVQHKYIKFFIVVANFEVLPNLTVTRLFSM